MIESLVGVHRRLALAAIFWCAVGTALAGPSFGQAKVPRGTLFHLAGPRVYAPVVRGESIVLRIPLSTRPDVAPSGVTPVLTAVEFPGRGEQGLFEAFSVAMAHGAASNVHAPAVLLTINERTPLPSGTYHVRFALLSVRPSAQQGMSVDVQLRAPKLAAPPTIYITHTLKLFGTSDSDSGLVLHETSGQSRLAGLTVSQVQGPGNASQHLNGEVTVFHPPTVSPGGLAATSVKLRGHFPTGSSTGQLDVFSPQLAEPVAVSYQVRTLLWWPYLVALIALGVICGFFTRVWLVERIQGGEAKMSAFVLLDRLKDEEGRSSDASFLMAIGHASGLLEQAIEAGVATDIAKAVKTATDELDAAKKKLQADLDKAATAIGALNKALFAPWMLPETVTELLARRRGSLTKAGERIAAADAGAALELAGAIQDELPDEIRRAGLRWRSEALTPLQLLGQGAPTIIVRVAPALKTEASKAEAAVNAEVLKQNNPSLEELLSALHKAVNAYASILGQLANATSVAKDTGVPDLRGAKKLAVETSLESVSQSVVAADPQNGYTLRELTRSMRKLDERLRGLSDKDAAKVTEAVESADTSSMRAPDSVASAVGTPLTPPPIASAVISAPKVGAPERPVPEVKARRQLLRDRWMRSAVLGVIVTGIGYFFFADNFAGTTGDVLGAFGWGYTADVTSAFVVSALSGKTSPQAAAPASG